MANLLPEEAVILQIEGKIYGYSSEDFIKSVAYWSWTYRNATVLLDFSKVESIDSMGADAIAALIEHHNIAICSLPHDLLRMLPETRYTLAANFYDTVEEAVKKLNVRVISPISSERRRHDRINVCIPTTFNLQSADRTMIFKGVVTDLSEGGALIEYLNKTDDSANIPFTSGLTISNMELVDMKSGTGLRGSLVRLSNDHCQMGVGVRFDTLNITERNLITAYVRKRRGVILKIRPLPPESYSPGIRPAM